MTNAKYDITEDKENPALGHIYNFDEITDIVYADYTKDGKFTCGCDREGCEGVKAETVEGTALFAYLGYSKNNEGDMCVGYSVDRQFVEYYGNLKGESFKMGFIATIVDFDENGDMKQGENDPLALGYTGNVVYADITEYIGASDGFDMVIKGFAQANAALSLVMNLYVIDNGNNYYIWDNEGEGTNLVANYKQYSTLPQILEF